MKRKLASVAGAFFAAVALIVASAPSMLWFNHPEAPAQLKEKLSK